MARYEAESVYSRAGSQRGSYYALSNGLPSSAGSGHARLPPKPSITPYKARTVPHQYGPTYNADDNIKKWVESQPPSVASYPNPEGKESRESPKKSQTHQLNPFPTAQHERETSHPSPQTETQQAAPSEVHSSDPADPPEPPEGPPNPVDLVSALSRLLSPPVAKPSQPAHSSRVKLSSFTGDGTAAWEPHFCHMRMVQKANAWSDAELVQEFGCKLQGKALEYYYTLESEHRETDLAYVDNAMQRRFGDLTHPAALRTQLENLKQAPDQTLEDLAANVRKLAYKVCADESPASREKNAVRWFIQAIASEQVKQMLFLPPGPATIHDALELAAHIRDMRSTYVRSATKPAGVRQFHEETPETPESPNESEMDPESLKYWVRYFVENSFQTQNRRTPSNKVKADTECWFCHKKGHWARECNRKPQNWPEWLKVLWSAHEWSEASLADKTGARPSKEAEQLLKEIQTFKDDLFQQHHAPTRESNASSVTDPAQVPQPSHSKAQHGNAVARTITYSYADGTSETAPLPAGVTAMVRRVGGPAKQKGKGRGGGRQQGQHTDQGTGQVQNGTPRPTPDQSPPSTDARQCQQSLNK